MLTFARLFRGCLREGESPEDAASRFGVSESTARHYFNGRSLPTSPKIPLLAMLMGVPVERIAAAVAADRKRLAKGSLVPSNKSRLQKPRLNRSRAVGAPIQESQQVAKLNGYIDHSGANDASR